MYTKLELSSSNINFEFSDYFNNIVFTKRYIESAICKLDPFSSPGPDNALRLLTINCALLFIPYLTKLFNWSISCGIFPTIWNSSYITPHPKGGDLRGLSCGC